MGINMTGYDLVIVAIFAFFMARGIWVGLLRQVTVIVALYVGYLVSGQYHDKLFPFLRGVSENPQIVFLVAYAILFACTYVLTMLLGKVLARVVQLTIAGWFDKVLGAIFGAIKALILTVILHMLLTAFMVPDSPMLRKCQLCPYLTRALTLFQQVIRDDTVRQAFEKKKAAIPELFVPPAAVPGKSAWPSNPSPEQAPEKKAPVEQAPPGSSSAVQ